MTTSGAGQPAEPARPADRPAEPASPADRPAMPHLRGPESGMFRHVLGHYPTGVAVITASGSDGPIGMAMNSFTSVSMDPPLVLFCPALSSSTWPGIREAEAIAVNVLSSGQQEVSRAFARRDVDRFAGLAWASGSNGAPLLLDALGWLECRVQAEYPAGDHVVVIAAIERMGVHDDLVDPLVFFRGGYYEGIPAAAEADD